jgi:hypothetical protein
LIENKYVNRELKKEREGVVSMPRVPVNKIITKEILLTINM